MLRGKLGYGYVYIVEIEQSLGVWSQYYRGSKTSAQLVFDTLERIRENVRLWEAREEKGFVGSFSSPVLIQESLPNS